MSTVTKKHHVSMFHTIFVWLLNICVFFWPFSFCYLSSNTEILIFWNCFVHILHLTGCTGVAIWDRVDVLRRYLGLTLADRPWFLCTNTDQPRFLCTNSAELASALHSPPSPSSKAYFTTKLNPDVFVIQLVSHFHLNR